MKKLLLAAFLLFFATGCTSLYFYPSDSLYPYYKFEKVGPEDLFFKSSDGTPLHAWHFEVNKNLCTKPKAMLLHYHGNAENLSSHYRMLHWMTDECYDYYIFDYRSYGRSGGDLDPSGILLDARAAMKYFANIANEKSLPFIVYGQSMGGTLALRSLQLDGKPDNLKALVIESSFYNFKQLGREKLASFWLTWPFQWLPYILVSGEATIGGRGFEFLEGTPKVLIYSRKDPVVPYENNGPKIYREMPEPKWYWPHDNPGHINSMFSESGKYRKKLISWLDWVLSNSPTYTEK